jgi:hypothetical protein
VSSLQILEPETASIEEIILVKIHSNNNLTMVEGEYVGTVRLLYGRNVRIPFNIYVVHSVVLNFFLQLETSFDGFYLRSF